MLKNPNGKELGKLVNHTTDTSSPARIDPVSADWWFFDDHAKERLKSQGVTF